VVLTMGYAWGSNERPYTDRLAPRAKFRVF